MRRFFWQRLRPIWLTVRWPLIGAMALLAMGFGYWGFDLARATHDRSLADKLYLALQLFGLESGALESSVPWPLQMARFLAPAVTVSAAATALLTVFRDQLARVRVRWFARRHVVVCGLGQTGTVLAWAFRARGFPVVAIELQERNPSIGGLRQDGVTVIVGSVSDPLLLRTARVDRARYIFVVCGDDAVNSQVAIRASELARAHSAVTTICFVKVLDADLAALVGAELGMTGDGGFRLEFFNPAERGAAALLNAHPPFDDSGATPFGPPHLVVVGLGDMGSRVVVHAAERWATSVGAKGSRFLVTIVDNAARQHVATLRARHLRLETSCEILVCQTDVNSPEFERGDFLFDAKAGRDATSVYVCLGDDALGLAAALRLHHRLRRRRIPIVVRTKQLGGLPSLLERIDQGRLYYNIHVFGLLDRTSRPEEILMTTHEMLARAIHEEYVRNQAAAGDTPATNPSMRPWEELDEHTRDSNRHQAADIRNKLTTIGCDIERITDAHADPFEFSAEELEQELERLSRMEHERWWREKEADGWKRGPVKDGERREHPDMVPWEELSEATKEKDRQAVRYIPALLVKAGFRIVRLEQQDGRAQVSEEL